MKYFDLHCDTATEIFTPKWDLYNPALQINHKALESFEKCYQVFAIWSNDEKRIHGIQYFKDVMAHFLPLIKKEKNMNPIFAIEGGHIIEGDINNLDILKAYDIRIFGFSWNGENALAAGNVFDPARPLSPLGLEVLKRLGELDIIPDISHLSDRGVEDIIENSDKPFLATHSNSRKVFDHPRNCTDRQISEIFKRGGLIGLNLYQAIISETPCLDDLMKHIYHMLELGGENYICLGCDWDGMTPPDNIRGVEDTHLIYEKIAGAFSQNIADKIVYLNACNFFKLEK